MSRRVGDPGYSATWCINFRGMDKNDTCEKGVNDQALRREGRTFDLPCFAKNLNPAVGEPMHCEHRRAPTAEEVAAHQEWIAGRMDRLRVVMVAIRPFREANKGRSASAIQECPLCNGRLRLSIAGSNGHVHGRCETADCVRWME